MHLTSSPPEVFKGIALFTPGGDLIYCVDPDKQGHWHLHLCMGLKELLGLPEPPHFLVPYYTATIDCWIDPHTQQLKVAAEAYPPTLRYQLLLNAIFASNDLVWHPAPLVEGICDPIVLATYRDRFPQLWESHDLVVRFDQTKMPALAANNLSLTSDAEKSGQPPSSQGCVLRLFISGHNLSTEKALQRLHQLLDRSLLYPYTLKIIDVLKHPELAEEDQISATPTLIRIWPLPTKRIVGTLNDPDRILTILGIAQKNRQEGYL